MSSSSSSSSRSESRKKQLAPVVSDRTSFLCGLTAGILQAGFFNPFDRALYLSVKNNVPFLTKQSFAHPYQGFAQSVVGRALSGGLYYPLEHFFMTQIPPESGPWANFLAGTGAGMTNALILNPITAIKYKTWSRVTEVKTTMFSEAKTMYLKGGLRPFTFGLGPTLVRDVVFGGCYTYLRLEFQFHGLPPEHQWMGNMAAAALATILSGPLNLARNVQYGTKSRKTAPTIVTVFLTLAQQIKEQPSTLRKWIYLQNRLRIGWGTARVAIGMAFGQFMYEELMWRMAFENDDEFATTDRIMVEKPMVAYPTRRPSLVRYRQTQMKSLRDAIELEDV
jgi:hypothetical protein